jgi:hypothetical protein
LEKLNKLKEEEFKQKVEKEQIKRAVKDLDKEKLVLLKNEKEIEQERLAQEANLIKRRERELQDDLDRIQGNIKETAKIYEENRQRVNDAGQEARKVSNTEDVRRRMFEEKAQRVADLRARQDNLYAERNMLDKAQNELRGGVQPDRDAISNLQEKINVGAQRHLDDIRGLQNYTVNNMKEKVKQSENRLDDLKNKPYESLPRPMSKKALMGENIVGPVNYQANRPPTPNVQGYYPALEVIDNRQNENDRLRDEVERLREQLQTQRRPIEGYPPNDHDHQPIGPNLLSNNIEPPYVRNPNPAMNNREFPVQRPPPVIREQRPAPQQSPPQMQRGPAKEKDFDDFLTSNFMQNQMKNVDLNEDERMLVHITMMEADALRILNRINKNTDPDLYRFKVEQYKELSTQRAEVEKLVQETRLKKMKRAMEMRMKEEDRRFENQRFVDEVRKNTAAQTIAKKTNNPQIQQIPISQGLKDMGVNNPNVKKGGQQAAAQGEYNQDMGFTVHWDYVFGIPKNKRFCQLVYAVQNGEESVMEPQLVEPRGTQDQSVEKNQCVIYENNNLREIEPEKNSILIIEVQMPTSMSNVAEYTSLGWTFINLFDINLNLNRGKFKLPLYKSPIIKNANAQIVDQLVPIMGSTILFRISYPWKDEFSNLKNLEPHLNQGEYQISPVHIKQAMKPGVLATNLGGAKPRRDETVNQSQTNYLDEEEDEVPDLPQGGPSRRVESRGGRSNQSVTTKTDVDPPHELIARSKGVKIIIHSLQNYKPPSKVKIAVCLMDEQFILRDDLDQNTKRFSTVHNPEGKDAEDGPGAGDKRRGGAILEFEEDQNFMLNVPKHVRTSRRNVYLCFQILEINEELIDGDKSVIKGSKYQLRGWYCHKLNEPNGKVIVGTHEEYLYNPPQRQPPVNPKDVATLPQSIEFSVEEITSTGTTRRKLNG